MPQPPPTSSGRSVALILVASIVGASLGVLLSATSADPLWATWLGMPGTLYLRVLKLLVAPLVFCSVITGFSALSELGVSSASIGPFTAALYVATSIAGALEGIAITYTLMPFWGVGDPNRVSVQPATTAFDACPMITMTNDAFRWSDGPESRDYYNATTASRVKVKFDGADAQAVVVELQYWYARAVTFKLPGAVGPSGPLTGDVELQVWDAAGALAFEARNGSLVITGPASSSAFSDSIERLLHSIFPENVIAVFYNQGTGSPDMLSLIAFAVAFAIAIVATAPHSGGPSLLTQLFKETLDATMLIVLAVVRTTPVAVASLILQACATSSLDELSAVLSSLSILLTGAVLAFSFHILVFMPVLTFALTRSSPYAHLRGMPRAMLVAFGSASSAVALPVNMACCEELGYEPGILRFVLSLGATISMDGTALYYPMALLWLAAQAGIAMSAGEVLLMVLISVLASMGASPTPGMIATIMLCWTAVFPTVPVPQAIGYLAAVDWFVDRCVTTTNVTGDSFVVKIVDHVVGGASLKAQLQRASSRVSSFAEVESSRRELDFTRRSIDDRASVGSAALLGVDVGSASDTAVYSASAGYATGVEGAHRGEPNTMPLLDEEREAQQQRHGKPLGVSKTFT